MAHYAFVQDGKVLNVIVAESDFFINKVEEIPGKWIQTSYNTRGGIHYEPDSNTPSEDQSKALRYNYAKIGGNYDRTADAFYSEQPYNSWSLNTETYTWEAPVAYPTDGLIYRWNEDTQQWVLVE